MDSTLKSNLSVGLPLDLLVYEANALKVDKLINIDENNTYFRMIRSTWGSACARCLTPFQSRPGTASLGRWAHIRYPAKLKP